jgi:hypothetical protein
MSIILFYPKSICMSNTDQSLSIATASFSTTLLPLLQPVLARAARVRVASAVIAAIAALFLFMFFARALALAGAVVASLLAAGVTLALPALALMLVLVTLAALVVGLSIGIIVLALAFLELAALVTRATALPLLFASVGVVVTVLGVISRSSWLCACVGRVGGFMSESGSSVGSLINGEGGVGGTLV